MASSRRLIQVMKLSRGFRSRRYAGSVHYDMPILMKRIKFHPLGMLRRFRALLVKIDKLTHYE